MKKMKIIGVICEYNPFHLGHLYQINKIKEKYNDCIIVAIVSSCFTQRGEVCIINKWDKAKIALDYGIDIVLELPFLYATSSADIFAKGAITILNKIGIDTLVFGTECDDIDTLKELAYIQLNDDNYDTIVKSYLDRGYNYPSSLNKALFDISGVMVDKPNDLLALSYIKQVMLINNSIDIINIKRTNDYHSKVIDGDIINASLIRKYIIENKDISNFIPNYDFNYIYKDYSINNYYPILKYQIINNIDNLDKFLTVDEGIENRIKKYINISNSWDELVNNIKTKRYTYNKINRMLIYILTNLTKKETEELMGSYYIRVLGFNDKGKNYLNKIKKEVDIITKYIKNKNKLFDLENRINNIYSLYTDSKLINDEYTHKPIIKD